MIRLSKPVKLLEWGHGSNTTNQRWIEMGKGSIVGKPRTVDGITTLVIQFDKKVEKSNPGDDTVKVAQAGEGMTPLEKEAWGEVAFGRVKSISTEGGGAVVEVEVKSP